jgi:predicted adenylyl cyclase CyaB
VIELELKAAVPDPAALRASLAAAGARAGFAGRMHDRRFDRAGELFARDEVLRTRRYVGPEGSRTEVTWKGPVSVDRGYKRRMELEYEVDADGVVDQVFEALGYRVSQAIDRYVEYYELGGATIRLEWYPRLDVLVEIEGDPESIEAAAAVTGQDRNEFSSDALTAFVARYEAREGRPAAIALSDLDGGERPAWPEPADRP